MGVYRSSAGVTLCTSAGDSRLAATFGCTIRSVLAPLVVGRRRAILRVSHLLEPLDDGPVEAFVDRDV